MSGGHPARAALILLVLSAALGLAGCGKKGDPGPPAGTNSQFPRQMPKP